MRRSLGDGEPVREDSEPVLRADHQSIARIYGDTRSADRIIAHYRLERRLADDLRRSTRHDRERGLYSLVYNTLLSELDDHPRKSPTTGSSRRRRQRYVERQARLVLGEVRNASVFVEIGGGDCEVALRVAPHVARAIVVDVADDLVPVSIPVQNFEFIKTIGADLPLASGSADFVYSNQLMEHLHPDDAIAQLHEIWRILKPGGRYLCRTPNRVTGPHDVSRYFDDVSCGMHIREYTYGELERLFTEAGFRRIRLLVAPRALHLAPLPRPLALHLERWLAKIPREYHTLICRNGLVRALMGITLIGTKPGLMRQRTLPAA